MNKTQFETRIYQVTKLTLPVLQMIAVHNSGETLINLAVIEAHVKTLKLVGMANWDCVGDNEMLCINENGKPALTITEHELIGSIELTESEQDLLMQEKLS